MLSKGRVDQPHICEYLGRVPNPLVFGLAGGWTDDVWLTHREKVQSLLKVLLIVCLQGSSPGLQFCLEGHW